jgi:predicted dehydrogenase
MEMSEVTIAVVGCGAIAHWHLDAIERGRAPIRVTAAVDPVAANARRVAERAGATPHASLAAALADRTFDAVLIAVPHHLHEPVATEALAAGLHVLLEEPLAPTLDACDRILAAADEAGTVFMVAENAQYWPEVLTVRRLIADGAIGEVVTARAATFFPALGEFYGGDRPWRFDRDAAGGGVVIDTGSHWLRPLRVWLGEADETIAALGYPNADMEGESLCRALIRFDSGVVAAFDADFASAVLHGTPPAAPPAYALGELRLALAMYRSAETQRWEKVWA